MPASSAPASVTLSPSQEVEVQLLELSGFAAESGSQFSSLAWYGDQLILLPQYPRRFREAEDTLTDGSLLAIPQQRILDYINGKDTVALVPIRIPFYASGILDEMRGYQGFESLVFLGDRAYLTAEADVDGKMVSYLVEGSMAPDLSGFRLDTGKITTIKSQADLSNQSDEAILIYQDNLITMYEANGKNINPDPVAHKFDLDLEPEGTLPFPQIEYRITDATQPDSQGIFWAMNYFFTGDQKLLPAEDLIAKRWGEGATHARFDTVERLVAFQITPDGIKLVDWPPIQLQLIDDDHARNWEGIVELDRRGFLLVTDTFPESLLGFVPAPGLP